VERRKEPYFGHMLVYLSILDMGNEKIS